MTEITLAAAARYCGITVALLREWIKQGVVPAVRRGHWISIAPETLLALRARVF